MLLKKRGGFENSYPGFWKRYRVFLLVVGVILLGDQLTKFWVVENLSEGFVGLTGVKEKVARFWHDNPEPKGGFHYMPKPPIEVSEQYLRFNYAENTGAAFSLFATWPEKVRRWFFNIISIIAVMVILYVQARLPKAVSRKEIWIRIGLPLVLGGALGNYVDRLARGFVVDFIQAHWQNRWAWPSFNIADIAISAGMICLILDALLRKDTKRL